MTACAFCPEQSKYKCPQCKAPYCSLGCYKSASHTHDAETTATPTPQTAQAEPGDNNGSAGQTQAQNPFDAIIQDPEIKGLLSEKTLQVHLAVILRILQDLLITNEPMADNRREIANMRLCELRVGGLEENVLVEQFVQRVLELYNKASG